MGDDEDLDYAQARDKFIAETRSDLQANLSRHNLWKEGDPLPLRIVSKETLYDYTKDTEEHDVERETGVTLPPAERKGGKKRTLYIDEPELVYDFLKTAHERRYSGGDGDGDDSSRSSFVSIFSSLGVGGSSDL